MTSDFTIHTERLTLRQVNFEDVEELFDLMSKSVDTQYLSWEPHKSIEETKNVVSSLISAQENDNGYHWCVVYNNAIIGLVSFIDVRRVIRTWIVNRAELSYWISNEHTGYGFATEAAQAVLNFGFSYLGFHKIIIAHANENNSSRKICEKLCFSEFGIESHAFYKIGKWYNLVWYEKLSNII